MNMRTMLLLFVALVFTGCASAPQSRPEYTSLPALETGLGRIYVSGGSLCSWAGMCVKLWAEGQVGPVFIDGQRVWTFAKNEHIAIDLLPGVYEAYWVGNDNYKFYSQKTAITVTAGGVRYFATDLETRAGASFGLIGALASEYLYNGIINEKQNLDSESKLVSYLKFDKPQITRQPVQQPSSEVERLRAEAEASRQRQRQLEEQLNQARQPPSPSQPVVTPNTDRLSLDASKVKCTDLGFKPGTEAHGKCVLQLSKQ